MARKDHLLTIQSEAKLAKKFLSRNNAIVFQAVPPTIAQQINNIGATSKTPDEVKDTKFPVLGPINEIGKNLSAVLDIDLSLENSPFHCLELSDVGATVATLTVNLINLVKNKAEKFILDITKDVANTIDPTIIFSPIIENLPSGFPTADPRYLLEIVARETPTETRYEVVNRISGAGTIPVGTTDFQHLEWDNTGLKWNALIAMTFQNVTGLIKWKNALATEEASLNVTSLDNFLWQDFTTGAPHTMNFNGLQLQAMGHIRSGNIPTPTTGFIQLGNTDSIDWRNAANTNNASFEFNATDKFEFTDLAAGGILATINGTELDLKIGGLLLTMGNNKAIQFRNAADTEFSALTLSGTNNFTWVDASTGAPHDMIFAGLQLKTIGFLQSGNIPNASAGFVRMANLEDIRWRNAGNTADEFLTVDNDDVFLFSGPIKFEATLEAQTGQLRMRNTNLIAWRNQANTNDVTISVDASNNWVFTSSGVIEYTFKQTELDMLANSIRNVGFFELDGLAAAVGQIRLRSTSIIAWRNAANTADENISLDVNDDFAFTSNIDLGTNFMDISEIATPLNPAVNVGRLYVKDLATVTTLFFRDSAGTETNLLAGGGGNEFSDVLFRIFDDIDNTRKIAFQAGGIATGTTRTLTVQDVSGTIALLDGAVTQTFSNDVQLLGNIQLGNATTDNITGSAKYNMNIIANQASGGDIGSITAGEEFFNVYSKRFVMPQFGTVDTARPSMAWQDLAVDIWRFNVPTGDEFHWYVGITPELKLSNVNLKLEGVDLDMDLHDINNLDNIFFNVTGQVIRPGTTNFQIETTSHPILLQINGLAVLKATSTKIEFSEDLVFTGDQIIEMQRRVTNPPTAPTNFIKIFVKKSPTFKIFYIDDVGTVRELVTV